MTTIGGREAKFAARGKPRLPVHRQSSGRFAAPAEVVVWGLHL